MTKLGNGHSPILPPSKVALNDRCTKVPAHVNYVTDLQTGVHYKHNSQELHTRAGVPWTKLPLPLRAPPDRSKYLGKYSSTTPAA